MSDQNQLLLQTKLHQPHITRGVILRARLLEQLDNGINRPLTLVCAPAGFGKTTLVCTWLDRMAAGQSAAAPLPVAWLSLDENDSDLNFFLRYFIAALRTIFNGACEETQAMLQAQRQPPQAVLYTTFSNELERLPGEFILALDDYHSLHGVDVHNLLSDLARHWPKLLHLVLITRLNPPLSLSSLRAKGILSEIRARDLRFTPQETAAYLSQSQVALQSPYALQLLEERLEGWPAGLHLAVLSLRSAGSQESVLAALSSENANITGYLVDEVLTHQPPAIQTFLLKSSILDRFCAPLCEEVIGEIDAAWNAHESLDWIERSELFISPLDDRRKWYRYHHLFQELLQQRLSAEMAPDHVSSLHRLASAWFEEHGLLDEALQHALAAGDLDLAARQMNAGLRNVLNRADRPTLERWLRLLPEEMINRRPDMLMIKVWSTHFLWRLDLLAPLLTQVEALLEAEGGTALPEDDRQLLRGQILSVRAQLAYFSNQTTQVIEFCRQVLVLVPSAWTFVRGGAMLYLGMSMQASGQTQEAERLLLEAYESSSDKTNQYALRILNSLGFIYLNTGRLEQVRQVAQLLLQGASRSSLTILKNWGDYFLGLVCYQRNELEAAAQHFTIIANNPFASVLTAYRDAVAGLALIRQFQGESAEARQMVESISQFDLEQMGREDERTRSLRARLLLLQGDLEGAGQWADTFTGLPMDQPLLWIEEPQVTRVRVLVARGADADLRLAGQILDALEEIAGRTHNTRYQIELLALRALALDAMGQDAPGKTSAAAAELKQALDLARWGGFIRVFVDLGIPMLELLRRLAEQDHAGETINRILAAFPGDGNNLDFSQNPVISVRASSTSISTLVEPLTPREVMVLKLLREPVSNKEIALKLNISYATTKRHIINVYGKLGVNQRWDAVARAIELGILPPD